MRDSSNEAYKKTYAPFIVWMLVMIAATGGVPFLVSALMGENDKLIIDSILLTVLLCVQALMYLIWRGEYVYWINGGPTFEQAKSAGSEARRRYARAHLDLFSKASLAGCAYLALSVLLTLPELLDAAVVCALIIAAACKTMPIRFDSAPADDSASSK